ncbi:hypothetical protein A2755_03430 [Candidatus Wolfebacteria bacterium RIFCSPHIGHO2_01_FULL_48_22]|uniref:Uncharacterized protein n=2 Tax=Candidatus Wolfeibacteriota TaxID=1752735 RepID=A0A1F8DRI7_9BACT|nr:MAG: hypothetical protein A2755_03430 [Candidatus Wolfebacteria bacterium RIFCSPHIGHO2_01_FULL_48_22]OGM92079.1 MAG: hypothetical protein A2935_01920 [Candidatus Wolfebacteria bacterium RIFCSPLOWO2_01_FULL_47_17b]
MKNRAFKVFLISCIIFTLIVVPFFAQGQVQNAPSGLQDVGSINIPIIGFVVKAILYLGLVIEGLFIALVGQFVGIALGFNATILNFDPPFITIGWSLFRDIANLGFVIGIVVIAVMTILRVKGYQAQQILWKLVVAALVVNFSLLIGGAIIAPANAISCFILSYFGPGGECTDGAMYSAQIGDSFRFIDISTNVARWSDGLLSNLGSIVGIGDSASLLVIASMAVVLIFGLVMFLTLLAIAGMLFLRYFYLSFLLIISPVVWLLWIFPHTKQHFRKWWSKFIHWVLYAPFMLLFIYLALRVLDLYADSPNGVLKNATASDFTWIAGGDNTGINFGLLMTSIFASAILIGGLKLAAEMGHGGTTLALGAVTGMQKWGKNYIKTKSQRAGARAGVVTAGKASAGLRGTMQKWSEKSGTWGKVGKVASKMTAPLQRGGIQMEAALQKKAYEGIEEKKKTYAKLSTDQQIAMLKTTGGVEGRAALLELLEGADQLSVKNTAGIDTSAVIADMAKKGRGKEAAKVAKKLGKSIDVARLETEGKQDENGWYIESKTEFGPDGKTPKRVYEGEIFDKVFEGFSKDDIQNFVKNNKDSFTKDPLGTNTQVSDRHRDAYRERLRAQILNPLSNFSQNISLVLKGAKDKMAFYEQMVKELVQEVGRETVKINGLNVNLSKMASQRFAQGDVDGAFELLEQSQHENVSKMAKKLGKTMGAQLISAFEGARAPGEPEGEKKAEKEK